jgi:formylglycine-generating enzyme required for sulfatase activity
MAAGTLTIRGSGIEQSNSLSAGKSWNKSDLAAGTYTVVMQYADGNTETRTVSVMSGQTAMAGFTYRPAPFIPSNMVWVAAVPEKTVPSSMVWIAAEALRPAPSNMIQVAAATFIMGSPTTEAGRRDNEGPQHPVTISKGFYLGKFEVTVGDFRQFVDATGYKTEAETSDGGRVWTGSAWETKADANWKNPYIAQNDNHPVVQVSWNDAIRYCNWKSEWEGLTPAYTISGTDVKWNKSANGYRLPTEAEWEYACRAGTTTPYSSGSSVDSAGWYYSNSGGKTHEVGTKAANGWGMYDMHGNVWEWCWDWYGSYVSGPQTDPSGAASGADRV